MDVRELEETCKRIMRLDPKIRSAEIINERGHLIAGGMKEGLEALEESRQDEMIFMELALRVKMRHEFDKEFGPVYFSLSYREKVVIMSFPLKGDNVLVVSAEIGVDFMKIPFQILKAIHKLRDIQDDSS